MSDYESINDPNLLVELTKRKEFYQYSLPNHSEQDPFAKYRKYDFQVSKFMLTRLEEEDVNLNLKSYQSMLGAFMAPHTPYQRILVKWDPGMGKTIATCDLAMQFIRMYEKEAELNTEDNQIGTVYIIGFTADIYKKELLSYPKYGFVTRDEIRQMNQLTENAFNGNKLDVEKEQEFKTKLRKRLTSRRDGGYFKFIGFKEFVNKIFDLANFKKNINDLTEDEIGQALQDGSLQWNLPLLDSFSRNCMVICDEIHITYNSLEKNNWGIALQKVFDKFPTLKVIFNSATPFNNSPHELVDMLNLLLPPNQKVTKADFFHPQTGELLPNALDKIASFVKGRVSYVQDINPKYFAEQIFIGDSIPGISYLKFIRCPMSKFHYATYKANYTGALSQDAQYLVDMALPNPDNTSSEAGLYKTGDIKRQLSQVDDAWVSANGFKYNSSDDIIIGPGFHKDWIGYYSSKNRELLDLVLKLLKPDLGKVFIFHPVVHISGVLFIEQLLLANGIIGVEQSETQDTLCSVCGIAKRNHPADTKEGGLLIDILKFSGPIKPFKIDNIEPDNDYAALVAYDGDTEVGFVEIEKLDPHDDYSDNFLHRLVGPYDVQIKLIEYLQQNAKGLLQMMLDPLDPLIALFESLNFTKRVVDSTTVEMLWTQLISGGAPKEHQYIPARYIMAHSDMDKSVMQKNLDKYNSVNNTNGYLYKYLVGSKIIKQSYNTTEVEHGIVVGRPDNIPTLLQILGRLRRNKGHNRLPPHRRKVKYYILVSSIPGFGELSHEELKYKEKIADYKIIQKIEKVFHENAIDSIITYNIIKPGLDPKNQSLGPLYYTPNQKHHVYKLDDLNLATFNVFYTQNEINHIIYILKRLYIEISYVFTFDELWKYVQQPPFAIEINTALFQKDYFIIALNYLIYSVDKYVQPHLKSNSGEQIDKLFLLDLLHNNIDKRIIMPNQSIGYIHYIDKYYIFIPFQNDRNMIHIEAPFRTHNLHKNQPINILKYLKETSTVVNYENRKLKFRAKYENVPLEKLATVVGRFGTQFHIQFVEELIEYVFNLWTNPTVCDKSEMHDFYFKMLYYYDIMQLIAWGAEVKEFIRDMYKDYLLPVKATVVDFEVKSVQSSLSKSNQDEFIKSSKEEYYKTLKLSIETLQSRSKSSKKSKSKGSVMVKADPTILPVGHFMQAVPRFYRPDKGWFESPEYIQQRQDYKENDLIIGYYEKSSTGLRIKFKIRTPIQFIEKHQDTRLVEKGSICASNSKQYLLEIAEKLKLKIPDKINVPNLCNDIEARLLLNEINERKNKTNVKWFYSFWETKPDDRASTSPP